MKTIFSISFAFLTLLSGMHLSLAKHICGGEVADMKWSFSGQEATCNMEAFKKDCPIHDGIRSNCCKNELTFFSVDNNYNPTTFQVQKISKKILQLIDIPFFITYTSPVAKPSVSKIITPPELSLTSAVSQADICIFRC